jgi:hypothetical protein
MSMNHIFMLSINLTAIMDKKVLPKEAYSNKCHHHQSLKKHRQQPDLLKL